MKNLAADANGATAIEYAMIASLVSIIIVTLLTTLGTSLFGFYNEIVFTP
ncbi:MAG TPA: Flp family type IVb pilin [Rhizomicrobium sp.]|jgi:pilus assembly protein Flp/PilA